MARSERAGIHRLEGVIKHYAWGSRHVLAELQGRPAPSPEPEAELWLGAHPNGPSLVQVGERWSPLDEQIREDPEYWLGPELLARHGPRLPFLMKVLAVEQPLSLQTHPDAQRAALVFEQERHLPIAEQRYTDPYAKPELVCALTRFEALCGVRPYAEILAWLADAGLSDLIRDDNGDSGAISVRDFLARWLRAPDAERKHHIARLLDAASQRAAADPISRRILALATHWPGDPGLIAPVLLHDITLEPGEALFLPAGVLHCYLSGAAIEVMAASDNVVRAGLTKKPIHVEELLEVASFEAHRPPVLARRTHDANRSEYQTPCPEFQLFRLDASRARTAAHSPAGPSILLCTEGRIRAEADGDVLELEQGGACVFAAADPRMCRVDGNGTGFSVALPCHPRQSPPTDRRR